LVSQNPSIFQKLALRSILEENQAESFDFRSHLNTVCVRFCETCPADFNHLPTVQGTIFNRFTFAILQLALKAGT
jgi:hypothetical protein